MLKELTTELIIGKEKVKNFIQSMTPKKKQSLDKQFKKAAEWKNAIKRGEMTRRLFAEELGFSQVYVHTDLSRKEIKQKIEEIRQVQYQHDPERSIVAVAWVGHTLRTDVVSNRKILSDLGVYECDP